MSAHTGSPIDVREVSRRFGQTLALDCVTLDVPAGSVHALLGRNGAGKTTLLRLLTGLVSPSSGTVLIAGTDVGADPHAVRDLISLVPSGDRSFYLRLSGFENLVFFARLRGGGRRNAKNRALRALEAVGLMDAARQRVGTYSHGMQKRLSIARALLHEPAVLLVDEATHDLDPEWATEVRRLVRGIAEGGAAVIWTTQRVDEVKGFADRLTLLDAGRVRFEGTVGALLDRAPTTRYVLGLRNGSVESLSDERVPALPAVIGDLERGPDNDEFVLTLRPGAVLGDAFEVLLRSKVKVVSCRQETPDVEDAFLRVLKDDG